MLQTAFTTLLNIDHPIVQGPLGPATTPELAAAVSNAGGLGSLSAVLLPADVLRAQIDRARELTDKPFAVNHILNQFDREAFDTTLEARPAVISFALGDPAELVHEAHAAGSLVMQQVVSVASAYEAAKRGVDVIIAQGSEAGGNTGLIATLPLVPQVVNAVEPIPVLAAGGIADGRGLAAMLALGAQGVNVGTRFLASLEAASDDAWRAAIVQAGSGDIVKFTPWNGAFPPAGGDYYTIPSSVRNEFIEAWLARERENEVDHGQLRREILAAAQERRFGATVPLAGQSSGLIDEVLPARQIIETMVAEAEAALTEAWQTAYAGLVPTGS